jgi:uncharacterized membrane protein YkoI
MNPWRGALLVLWFALALPGAAAAAASHELTMDQAVKVVERQYHARVVKAETRKSGTGTGTTYVLKLLNDSGKVWTVTVDAATGAVQ